ncbi:MAG TPA: TonB-dependent receptor [Caulobacteraceae bacterium]|nr:TonB-dependent receptor [Caulobacteraceae bacterium]
MGAFLSRAGNYLSCAAAIACAPAALAQDIAAPASQSLTTVGEVVVTGSRIPRPDRTGVSPLTQVTDADIRAQGAMRIEDVLNQAPQAYVDQNSTVTNGATGTATVNLRDLGPERTLVLIDGKRLMPGDPTSGSVAPDLNFIPDALVERIDIVTGGQSAVYGSDAVAGVVNFIMKRNFSGLQIDVQGGFYDHDNGQTGIQAVLAGQGLAEAPRTVTDGFTGEVTVVAGVNAPDGKANVTLYGGYRAAAAVTEASRDFSACQLVASGASLFCQGSLQSPALGRFVVFDQTNNFSVVGNLTLDPTGPGDTLRPFNRQRDAYNGAPYQYFQRPDERYTAGAFAHYEILPSVDLYVDGMFMYDNTTAQLAPSGLFLQPFTIACSNPMLSAAEVQRFCADANVPPGGGALVAIGRRNVEGGPRQFLLTHTDWRVVAGARGTVGDWNYDISAQVSAVDISQTDSRDVSLTRAADALDVVRNPSGALVCASGNPGCAPYDVFAIGGVTPAALAYLETPGVATGGTDEVVVSANVTGELGRYGVKSPWATSGVGVALGAEYRREGLSYSPNAELASGDLASFPAAQPAVNGHFDVYEVYGEARAPLAQDRGALLHDLTIDGGVRYSWYSNSGGAATYKAGLEWAPSPDLRLRAGYSRAVRAPNVVELFTPPTLALGLGHDPCAGANPVVDQQDPFATQANCARTGVTAAEYGHIAPSAGQYNSLEGGNPDLRPEVASTVTFGGVITPRVVPGLSLAVDYFDIRVRDVITNFGPDVTIEQCLQTGNPLLCSLVRRAPGTGSLWIGPAGYVSDVEQNGASLATRGVDVDMSYQHALPDWRGQSLGRAGARLIGTYALERSTVTVPGAPAFDCAGYYGGACGDPQPHWRHTLRVTVDTPWRVDLTATWRYVGPVTVSAASPNPFLNTPFDAADARLGARTYIDLSLAWRVNRRVEVRVGVNNLFDVDPPVVPADFSAGVAANANTYPGAYDALGRWLFVAITARL